MQSFNTLIAFGRSPDSSNAGFDLGRAFSGWSDSFADDVSGRVRWQGGRCDGWINNECSLRLRWRAQGVSALHRSQPPTLLDDVCSPAPAPPAPRTLAPRPTAFTTRQPPPHTYNYLSTDAWNVFYHILADVATVFVRCFRYYFEAE